MQAIHTFNSSPEPVGIYSALHELLGYYEFLTSLNTVYSDPIHAVRERVFQKGVLIPD